MKKKEAIEIFGTAANMARALGFTRGRISQWEDDLTQKQADMVIGAAVRLGKSMPARIKQQAHDTKDEAA